MQTDNLYQTFISFSERWDDIGAIWWILGVALLAVILIVVHDKVLSVKFPKQRNISANFTILFSVCAFVVFPALLAVFTDFYTFDYNNSVASENISKKYDTTKINDIANYDENDKTVNAYYIDLENGIRAKVKFAFTEAGEPHLLKDYIDGEEANVTTYDEVSKKIEKAS